MDDQNNIQDELRSLDSHLPGRKGQNPWEVPAGYFDGLAEKILAKAKAQEASAAEELQTLSPLLASLSKRLPYSVPSGYFDQNLTFLTSVAKEDEASPVLAAIGKELPYSVPPNYFEQVPQQVLASLNRPKAKVVPFFSRTWAKAAVAAAISGIIFFGGYRLLNKSAETGEPVATLQNKADSAGNPVAQNKPGLSPDIKNISAEEVETFIQNLPLNSARVQRPPAMRADRQEVTKWLKDVPQEEIDAFLEALPTADDNLLVID